MIGVSRMNNVITIAVENDRQGETERPKSPSLTATACSSRWRTRHAPGDEFGPIPRKWLQLMKGDSAGDAATAKASEAASYLKRLGAELQCAA